MSSIVPKNKCWNNFQYIKLSQRLFFGRMEDTIICFRDCLTFNICPNDCAEQFLQMYYIVLVMYSFESLFLLLYTAHALKVTAAAAAPPRHRHHTLLLCRPIGKVQTCVFIIRQGDHKNVSFSHTFNFYKYTIRFQ